MSGHNHRQDVDVLLGLIAVLLTMLILALTIGPGQQPPTFVPRCDEDTPYLQGQGDYSNGRWETYRCVHIDEVTP